MHKDAVHCIAAAAQKLRELLDASNVDESHGIRHALVVCQHAWRALQEATQLVHAEERRALTENEKLAVLLAALLHDADDRKFRRPGASSTANVEDIMQHVSSQFDLDPSVSILVHEMISLVSCSKHRNNVPPGTELWKLIPRWGDRLEAVGAIGIVRCYQYSMAIGQSEHAPHTVRVQSEEELERVASFERYESYDGNSDSIIDHFYDKLLHVAKLNSGNPYLESVAAGRHQIMFDYCLHFGQHGSLAPIEPYEEKARAEEAETFSAPTGPVYPLWKMLDQSAVDFTAAYRS
eukprot:TRINITY_DN40929_c0_g1_i1.p1 TRINITY_DN40929_c0_g1~~TRINITY_DN40929_c0_g1_i1.p1  ORF type:complete len:305 (+),score=52.15 TRINITY_DN40929_c0_g1_i1:37-915(+)